MTEQAKSGMTVKHAMAILSRVEPSFLEGLSEAEVEMVVKKAVVRRYVANAVITNEAFGANHLFLLLEGAARGYAQTSKGEKVGLGWFHAGRVMGWSALVSKRLNYVVSFEAAKPSSALVWDRATVRSLVATHPRLMENVLALAYDYVVHYRILHLAACCDSAEQRLAQVLGGLAKRVGHPVKEGMELHITNEELASEAHVTIFTVSRQIWDWQRQGLVKKSWGSVVVLKPDALLRIET